MIIYKYPLEITDTQYIPSISSDHKILKVEYQGEQLYAWIMVEPDLTFVKDIRIDIYGTGHTIPYAEDMTHLNTVFDPRGFVWHVFKVF